MSILNGVEDKRNFRVPEEKAFILSNGEKLYTLDQLSEAINLIEPEVFHAHVNDQKNDFAAWVGDVFEESDLAQRLHEHPTPLRMMVSIEKFLRMGSAAPEAPVASVENTEPSVQPSSEPNLDTTLNRPEPEPADPTMAQQHHGDEQSF